jgi:hypothetical protein
MERCGQRYTPINLPQGKRAGIHSIGGSVSSTTCAEDLALIGIRFPESSAGSESLYRLCYPSHIFSLYNWKTFPRLENLSLLRANYICVLKY